MIELADEQRQLSLKRDAIYNYHTACVYYRIIELFTNHTLNNDILQNNLIYAIDQMKEIYNSNGYYDNKKMLCNNLLGRNINEFYIIHENKLLGKGTYGSVYLATYRKTGKQEAVKIIHLDLLNSYQMRKIDNEIVILKCLDHPNIIKLQNVFFENNRGNDMMIK